MAGGLKRGDRVKLTARAAELQTKHFIPRSKRVDWFARRGTVHRVGKKHVYILWDDRRSLDNAPHSQVEKAEEES